eukprot:CAMPEP_0179922574 /NCGR_PEP_ID=MMETSP0983-20121128/5725_1 /TAXON_ID=483367 /ORGANISM="non described non described, Strain CCMP 2436" /LENGTH=150 /DNA_ID=CAMNT_0021825957 /DNA_START=137 /DNA_END=590 /DNA_ORIENTATION=+
MTQSAGKTSAARSARETSPSWTPVGVLATKGELGERFGPLQDCAFGVPKTPKKAVVLGAAGAYRRPRQPGALMQDRRHGPPCGCWSRGASSDSDAGLSRRVSMASPKRAEGVVVHNAAERREDLGGPARPRDIAVMDPHAGAGAKGQASL